MEPLAHSIERYMKDATYGDYATENEAKQAIRQSRLTDYFHLYEEVPGWYFGGAVFGNRPTGKIDFVLSPKSCLVDRGWSMGFIGIEVKKSGHKVGPLVCQMIDYSKAVFQLPDSSGGVRIALSATCCYPPIEIAGPLASVMANHRLGKITLGRSGVHIVVNSTGVFRVSDRGVAIAAVTSGFKNGSR